MTFDSCDFVQGVVVVAFAVRIRLCLIKHHSVEFLVDLPCLSPNSPFAKYSFPNGD